MRTFINKPPIAQALSVVCVLITEISTAIANFSVVLQPVSQLALYNGFGFRYPNSGGKQPQDMFKRP